MAAARTTKTTKTPKATKTSKATKNASPRGAVDDYLAATPPDVRPVLARIREEVRKVAPEATELVSYRMPAFRARRIFFYYAAFKQHVGVFPPVTGSASLQKKLARYRGEKGNLRFPLEEPMPYALIAEVAAALLREKG